MDGSKTLIARSDSTISLLFEVVKKIADDIRRDIFNANVIYRPFKFLGGKWKQQDQGVSIACLCVTGKVALANQMLSRCLV